MRVLRIRNSEHSSLFSIVHSEFAFGFMQAIGKVGSVIALALTFTSCQQQAELRSVTFTGPTMGTEYRVTIVVPSSTDLNRIESQIVGELEAVNTSMSTYLVDSELSEINRLSVDDSLVLSDQMNSVLLEAMEISKLSDGAFDITVADAVNLWGFGPDGFIKSQPSKDRLQQLRESIGHQNILLQGGVLKKLNSATKIDLSSIAKGFAVDQIARTLHKQQIDDFLIDVGGELRLSGLNVEGRTWRVAIEKPKTLGGIQQVIELSDAAIATSGDYRNFVNIDGKRYSHTIDPMTLEPVFHRLALVSVVSDKASTADALATAMMVLGEKRAFDFAVEQGLAAYFIIRGEQDSSEFSIRYSPKFEGILR